MAFGASLSVRVRCNGQQEGLGLVQFSARRGGGGVSPHIPTAIPFRATKSYIIFAAVIPVFSVVSVYICSPKFLVCHHNDIRICDQCAPH